MANPKIATLVDTFIGTTLDPQWQVPYDAGNVTVANNILSIVCQTDYDRAITIQPYDLTVSSIFAKVTPPATGDGTKSSTLQLDQSSSGAGTNAMQISLTGALLTVNIITGGAYNTILSTTFTGAAYLRIRQSGGTVYFDTAPDGNTWTQRASHANPSWAITALYALLTTGYSGTNTASSAQFANVNYSGPVVAGIGYRALKDQFPLRIIIGREDVTNYINEGWTFSSVDPGGFEMCSLPIPKDMPQTLRGQYIRIDCGLGVAWEGRVSEIQRSLGNETIITGEGDGALLKDNAASMVFVDRDLTRWQGPSVQRQINTAAIYNCQGAQVAADPTTGNPSIACIAEGAWAASPGQPLIEAWYDAGPLNLIGKIYYSYDNPSSGFGFNASAHVSSDANDTTDLNNGNIGSSASGSALWTPGSQYRFAFLQFDWNSGAGGTSNVAYPFYWQNVAVYGTHGLAGVGGSPVGFYPSQIVGWILTRVPAGLQAGVMPVTDATAYIMPHSAYYDDTGLDTMIQDMAIAAGWHWGVWPSLTPLTGDPRPRLDFRPYPAQGMYTASCRRADCDTCDIREDLSGMYDTAVVTYSDVLGNDQAVVATLTNPILQAAGNLHRTVVLNGGTMTAAAAAVFGAMALNLLYTQNRVTGSLVIKNAISSLGGPMAPWMLKPGIDRLRILDLPSTDAFGIYNDVPFNRMECTGSSDGYSTSLEVGSGQNLVETLQSRLAASAVLAAQGG